MFNIIPGNPKCNEIAQGEPIEDLSEAIEILYPMEADDMILQWRGKELKLQYKYDLCVIIADILDVLEKLTDKDRRKIEVRFGSDTFNADWEIEVVDEDLRITSDWHSVVVADESEFNEIYTVTVPKRKFVQDWMIILKIINSDIQKSHFYIEDRSDLERLQRLMLF